MKITLNFYYCSIFQRLLRKVLLEKTQLIYISGTKYAKKGQKYETDILFLTIFEAKKQS